LSASQFDAQYSAPASVFTLVESIFSANKLTTVATAPMLIMASGTDTQAQSALGQLSSEPASIQKYIIGVECMPETINILTSSGARIPHYTSFHHRGAYVGTSLFSGPKACTYNEIVSGFQVWYPCGLQTIYDEKPLLNQGTQGSHQTIALVDAFGDPETAAANNLVYNNIACYDLGLFDGNFSLPDSGCSVIYPTGVPVLTANNYQDAEGWSIETAIDMQYSHTMAPQAHILEVTASTDYDDLYASVEYVVNHQSANMISLSWGEWEDLFYYPACPAVTSSGPTTCAALMLGYDEIFQQAAAQGISVFVSSGDYAAYDPVTQEVAASSPATDPWVSAVGGTTLNATFTPFSVSRLEHAWSLGSDSYNTVIGTGGGFSMLFQEPLGQQLIHISTQGVTSIPEPALGITFYPQGMRGVPDLSADADPSTGVLVIQDGAFSPYVWGGTSLAAPLTAGMTATVQSNTWSITIGDLAPSLYLLYLQENGAFYVYQTQFSLSQLNQGVPGVMFETAYGQNGLFHVTPGIWNPVCGLGQLNVYGLSLVISGAD
ncbi:MAG TPA: S53 family peptidase, partial [Candidatus Acidoferrales bacterium]|nr:S53 family peptidase [Candidatus Acidoferrales bacterium]